MGWRWVANTWILWDWQSKAVEAVLVGGEDDGDDFLDWVHTFLGSAGLFPWFGFFPDLLDTLLYLIEMDWSGAGLSGLAIIPVVGQTAGVGKLAKLGRAGKSKGVREVIGDASSAQKLFDYLKGSNPVSEVKPGVFVAKGKRVDTLRFEQNRKVVQLLLTILELKQVLGK